ncbi:hypothetical protein AUJ68_05965 [Candidatus Woesearchaeota archaeon CG1_02_57_44]|nr:MAG: hypothetical protein AUJ68_05965 [Candidatus Woesearchaeota archaeon CG1_02_57_44]
MRVVLSGQAGTGKSTVAKMLAARLRVPHFSSGDFMREMAQERGMSLAEFSKVAEQGREIDQALDERQSAMGKSHPSFVLDSRLGWHFVHDAFKVFLVADEQVRAQRILGDNRETERAAGMDEQVALMRQREQSERKRYHAYYGLDPYDESNFDLVVDTTYKAPELVVADIIAQLPK